MNLHVGFYAENFFWSSCAFEEDLPNEFFQNDLSEYSALTTQRTNIMAQVNSLKLKCIARKSINGIVGPLSGLLSDM